MIRRMSLRWRLALALALVAILSVALATVLSTNGLHRSLDEFARARLQAAAGHTAELAAAAYAERGGLTPDARQELAHLAQMNGYVLLLGASGGGAPSGAHADRTASAPVVVRGRQVASVTVRPSTGDVLTGEDQALQQRLNNRHLLAAGLALLLGLAVAGLLATALTRPLRRMTRAARQMRDGDLSVRVPEGGAPELRELGSGLNRLASTLEAAERARRNAAADVAHELRTPVAAIVSRIEAARDGVLTDETANLGALHTEALRLTRLVEDLGRLVEAERPGWLLEKIDVDLAELATTRADEYGEYLAAKGIDFTRRLQPAQVCGDPARLAQVIDNLLSNALRYTDGGGSVVLDVRTEGGEAVLSVADSGIGIAPDEQPLVFERFWRGEPSRARATGGAGIGLAIVAELVRAHDGRVDLVSTPGEGSVFTVRLPGAQP